MERVGRALVTVEYRARLRIDRRSIYTSYPEDIRTCLSKISTYLSLLSLSSVDCEDIAYTHGYSYTLIFDPIIFRWVGAALGGSVLTVNVTKLKSFNFYDPFSDRPRRLQELSIGPIH